jgi:hypothetical protein
MASTLEGTEPLRRKLNSYVNPSIAGSAALDAIAFSWQAQTLPMQIGAATIGLGIPARIFALTKIGAAMWIDLRKK